MAVTMKRKALAVGGLVLLLSAGVFLAQDYYHSQKVDTALEPCKEAMRLNPDSGGLPCYQAALRDYPSDQHLQMNLATNLVCLGRFEEARRLYEKAAGEIGLDTGRAKKMLRPGAMQRWKVFRDRDELAYVEYRAFLRKFGKEQVAFETTHPTNEEPYKTQLVEMIKAHVREEREMMIARGAWQPAVLKEPYFSVPKR